MRRTGIAFKTKLVKFLGVTALSISLLSLTVLLVDIFHRGLPGLTWQFLQNYPSRFPNQAGIFSALIGTFWLMGLTAIISIPIGVLTGVYLEEYAREGWLKNLIRVNISNLSGVPSIVYGILGLVVFVRFFAFERSVLSGALTMSLLILPVIIIATSESLRAVPASIRLAAFGVGASRSQVVLSHVLPQAMSGILTGIILALSRAIGESAPLIMVGALSFVAFVPQSAFDNFTVLSIQIFNWAGRPQEEFQGLAASGIIVLLCLTLGMNILAIYLRMRFAKGRI
jgi:phosphate transport system permease protein